MPVRAVRPLLIALLTLAACSGRQSTGGLAGVDADQPGMSPLYAALFVEGQVFRYLGHEVGEFWDDADPESDEFGTVTNESRWGFDCEVTEVETFSASTVSQIECGDQDRELVAGIYAADAGGLWRLSAFPEDESELAEYRDDLPILAAQPSPRSDTTEDEWGGSSIDVEQLGDGSWCVTEAYWGGDESAAAICFQQGRGITSAEHSFSGGSHQETSVWLED